MGCHYLKAACYVEFFFFIIYLYCAILKTSVEERKKGSDSVASWLKE